MTLAFPFAAPDAEGKFNQGEEKNGKRDHPWEERGSKRPAPGCVQSISGNTCSRQTEGRAKIQETSHCKFPPNGRPLKRIKGKKSTMTDKAMRMRTNGRRVQDGP